MRQVQQLAEEGRGSLRGKESRAYMRSLVERLSLRKALLDEKGEEKLKQAGFRSEAATTTFLFARFVLPFGFLALAIFYIFVVLKIDRPLPFKLGICLGIAYVGGALVAVHIEGARAVALSGIRLPSACRAALEDWGFLGCVAAPKVADANLKRVVNLWVELVARGEPLDMARLSSVASASLRPNFIPAARMAAARRNT